MCAYLRGCFLEAVRIHGGHDVNACGVDQVNDGVIALLILITEILSQIDEQLSAHGLITMHVPNVLKLRLTYHTKTSTVNDTTLYAHVC